MARTAVAEAPKAQDKKIKAAPNVRKIESVYREGSYMDQAFQVLIRRNGASKEDLAQFGRPDSLLFTIKKRYEVKRIGDRGAFQYAVVRAL